MDEFAAKVGLPPEAISDLEEADFQGDVLSVLQQIAESLNQEVRVQLVPRAKAA